MTGKQGFSANLTANQIINQINSLPERDGDRDFWMTAEEAKKYGMIDDVLTRK